MQIRHGDSCLTPKSSRAEALSAQNFASRSFFRAWLPTFLWLVVIAIESTDLLSSEHTGTILYSVFHWLLGLTPEQFSPLHAVLRKIGHVVGYGTLSALAFRSFRATAKWSDARWSIAWARNALLLTAVVASLDEWHQTFIPSRTGTIRDVLLDTSAALAAQILVFYFVRRDIRST